MLQIDNGVAHFWRFQCVQGFASCALMHPLNKDYLARLQRFDPQNRVPVITIKKALPTDDIAKPCTTVSPPVPILALPRSWLAGSARKNLRVGAQVVHQISSPVHSSGHRCRFPAQRLRLASLGLPHSGARLAGRRPHLRRGSHPREPPYWSSRPAPNDYRSFHRPTYSGPLSYTSVHNRGNFVLVRRLQEIPHQAL